MPLSARAKSKVVRRHPERPEDLRRHRPVVGRAQLHRREEHVPPDVAGGRRHRVRVLEHLPELAGRLHRPERRERALGRRIRELEQPLEVLPRQPRARADQVLDQHLARGVGVPELELRQELRDRRRPRDLLLIDQPPEQHRRHRLRVRRDHVERVRVGLLRLPQLLHPEPAGEHHLAALHERKRGSRHTELLEPPLDERSQLLDPRLVEAVGLPPRERLARVALREQPPEDESHLRPPLLRHGIRHVVDPHQVQVPVPRRPRRHPPPLVRRRLVGCRSSGGSTRPCPKSPSSP